MSVQTTAVSTIQELVRGGQSLWLDNVQRKNDPVGRESDGYPTEKPLGFWQNRRPTLHALVKDRALSGRQRIITMRKIEIQHNQVYRLARRQRRLQKLAALLRRVLHKLH